MIKVLEYFGDVVPFLMEIEQEDRAPATKGTTLEHLQKGSRC